MLAAYGLLDGEAATTHHMYERGLQQRDSAVHFVNGVRSVENDKISTAAGLTSGIDLALHVVERWKNSRTGDHRDEAGQQIGAAVACASCSKRGDAQDRVSGTGST